MSCETHRENLSAYLDGALPEEALRALEEHLAGCLDCQSERDALAQVSAQVRALPKLSAPPEFAASLMAKLGGEVGAATATAPAPCAELAEDLSALLDHHLDGPPATTARQHLADCDDCQARQSAWQRLRDRIGALPRIRVPGEFLAGIMARIEQIEHERQQAEQKQREARITLFSTIGRLAQAAAILAVVGGGMFLTAPSEPARVGLYAPFGGRSGQGAPWKPSKLRKESRKASEEQQAALPPAQAKLELSVADIGASKDKTLATVRSYAQQHQHRAGENSAEVWVTLQANQVDDLMSGLVNDAQVESNELAERIASELHAEQDRVVLKNGFVLVGQVLSGGRETRIRCGSTVHTVPAKDVERIERANETRSLRIVLHERE